MNYILLYFLAGAIVAVWTLINNLDTELEGNPGRRFRPPVLIAVCLVIALAWPISVIVFLYAIFTSLLRRPGNQDSC
jgi:hypothetical protein